MTSGPGRVSLRSAGQERFDTQVAAVCGDGDGAPVIRTKDLIAHALITLLYRAVRKSEHVLPTG